MSTVRVYSENGEQKFDSLEEAMEAVGLIQYEVNGEKYISGNGEVLTDKQYKELKMTDAEKICDAVSEKMEQVAEIYKNLNLIYNFEKKEGENVSFHSRAGETISFLKEKPSYYYDGKKNYFSKQVIEKFNKDRKARIEAVNKTMGKKEENTMDDMYTETLLAQINKDRETEMSMETLKGFIDRGVNVWDNAAESDKQAYMNEGRKAFIIKKAYDTVMTSGREIDKQEAQNMMDIYLAAFDDEKVLEPIKVEIRQTPESEYYKEAINKGFRPKDKVFISVPMVWVSERSKKETEERFDVVKFPQDFKAGAIKGKYEFYFNLKEDDGVRKEDGMCFYPFNYNDMIRLRKCIGKDPVTSKWNYDIQYVNVKTLDKAVNEYLHGKEKEQEIKINISEKEDDEQLAEEYGFGGYSLR